MTISYINEDRTVRQTAAFIIAGALLWAVAPPATVHAGPTTAKPNSSAEPTPAIPFDRLTGKHKARVIEILKKPVLRTQSTRQIVPCDIELMHWLIKNPDIVASCWRELGLAMNPVELIEDGYRCRDGDNASATFHIVLDEPGLRILYCIGEAKQPLLPPLFAELVIVQRYSVGERAPTGSFISQQLEGYASAKGPTLKTVMRLAKGTGQRVVESCLEETSMYFSVICRMLEARPAYAATLIEKMKKIHPAERLVELETILARVVKERAAIVSRERMTIRQLVEPVQAKEAAVQNASVETPIAVVKTSLVPQEPKSSAGEKPKVAAETTGPTNAWNQVTDAVEQASPDPMNF